MSNNPSSEIGSAFRTLGLGLGGALRRLTGQRKPDTRPQHQQNKRTLSGKIISKGGAALRPAATGVPRPTSPHSIALLGGGVDRVPEHLRNAPRQSSAPADITHDTTGVRRRVRRSHR